MAPANINHFTVQSHNLGPFRKKNHYSGIAGMGRSLPIGVAIYISHVCDVIIRVFRELYIMTSQIFPDRIRCIVNMAGSNRISGTHVSFGNDFDWKSVSSYCQDFGGKMHPSEHQKIRPPSPAEVSSNTIGKLRPIPAIPE